MTIQYKGDEMVYIEAILSLYNKHYAFRVDADDMKVLMEKAAKIINKTIPKYGAFQIILFNSNTMNIDHFTKLIEGYLT